MSKRAIVEHYLERGRGACLSYSGNLKKEKNHVSGSLMTPCHSMWVRERYKAGYVNREGIC
jgi:hypothetical protein